MVLETTLTNADEAEQSALNDVVEDATLLATHQEIFGRKKPQKEKHQRIHLDDEFAGSPPFTIDVMQPVAFEEEKLDGTKVTRDYTEAIRKEFEYLSATKGLEIGTARSDILQDYIDRMVAGNTEWEGKIRVLILNKGKDPTAFAYPDGSIFISQSLINLYDSIDEVVGVLAHEVKHIVNGTTRAAFKAEVQHGGRMGVGWLHEMTSDFGAPELLEKVGLKSTAMAEVLTKLAKHFGNRRDAVHQAPVLRAIEQLGVHAVKDFDTSHLDFTRLPSELHREAQLTNAEAIYEAAVLDDLESVKIYITKLHPKDFAEFFELVDQAYYYQRGSQAPDQTTELGLIEVVTRLVVERMSEEGLTPIQIKLFLLTVTSGYALLAPKFNDLDEITACVPTAVQMYEDKTVETISEKLFDDKREQDPLFSITHEVNYRLYKLKDKSKLTFIGIDEMANFLGSIGTALESAGLPPVENGRFDTPTGDELFEAQRLTQIYDDLTNILFDYIERYFLPNVPDGQLDPDQIEDIFRTVQEAGFTLRLTYYEVPIANDKIGPLNKKIIEEVYEDVFGIDLVFKDEEAQNEPLPTKEEFRSQIMGLDKFKIGMMIADLEKRGNLDPELKVAYVEVGLEQIHTASSEAILEKIIADKIGPHVMKRWKDTGDPTWNSMSADLKRRFVEAGGGGTVPEPRKLSIDELMIEYNLDPAEYRARAVQLSYIKRTKEELEFVAQELPDQEDRMFEFIESILQNSDLEFQTMDVYELIDTSRSLFALANQEDRGGHFRKKGVTDFERFVRLPLIQEILNRVQALHFENLQDLAKHFDEMKVTLINKFVQKTLAFYEDDLYSVILMRPLREEFQRLIAPGMLKKQDYPLLIELLQTEFPSSAQRREIVKALQAAFLIDPEVTIQDKIDFYFKEYRLLGIDGAITVAEQIKEISTYRLFKKKLDELGVAYVSGEESSEDVAATDLAGSVLTRKADVLIKTTSDNSAVSKEVSTDMAIGWVMAYLGGNDWRAKDIQFDTETNKFILTGTGRTTFISLADTIDYFKTLPDSKKLAMAMKALSDQEGLLVTENGKTLLNEMLVKSLSLKNEFFRQLLGKAILQGDPKVVGLPAAQMLVPFLFRALNVEDVDIDKVRNQEVIERIKNDRSTRKVKDTRFAEAIPSILKRSTRDLRLFGFRYRYQPNSEMSKRAQESNDSYFATLDMLAEQFGTTPELKTFSEQSLPDATEAMIKAGETSPVFVRGMQMAVQLINFEPAVKERLSHTQDSMKGMEKLRFWDNLLSKAENDSELARFLEEDLITLDDYLGGGSLFTTYGATIRDGEGGTKKVVIKMLNPNAEEFIRLSYEFSASALAEVEQNSRGKTRQDARFAVSLLDLSHDWCLLDINDTTYAERDDAFRTTVETYNQKMQAILVTAPERLLTSKKVKVEEQYEGTTLNKLLQSNSVSDEKKRDVVTNLLGFFNHQFEFAPIIDADGKRTYIFHSDPHAGNYMIDQNADDSKIGAIDRSMYLAFEEKDVEMFTHLKEGEGKRFINVFITRCLELSGIDGPEAKRVRYSIWNQIGGELLRQKISRRWDTSAYLQIIMQEFTKFGETFTATETDAELSPNERTVFEYLRANPQSESLAVFEALKTTSTLTYQELRKLLKDMNKKALIGRKAIDIPIEFRLMIRNIVAMQNLQKQWAA